MYINWARMAKPQDDGYDSTILADLDYRRFGWSKGDIRDGELVDGSVRLASPNPKIGMSPEIPFADDLLQDGRSWGQKQDEYLLPWSAGADALEAYLDEFWPFRANGQQGRGCSSGHLVATPSRPLHAVYVTVNDPQGCAQGIYHEFAHLRLETMGIGIDNHDGRLLLNRPDELYDSSVRFDVKRPMSAVLHGVYAWLMFTENDLQLYLNGVTDLSTFKAYSEHNIPKILNGIREIENYARWTDEGKDFRDGLFTWSDELVNHCRYQYGEGVN